jgi:hypothetical protein
LETLPWTATEPLLTEYKLLCIFAIMKTQEQNEPDLKRYVGRVSHNGKVISREYVDWFTDDDAVVRDNLTEDKHTPSSC